MPDVLRVGLEWLASKMHDSMSSMIEYSHQGNTKNIKAVFGHTAYERADDYGMKTGAFMNDFLIRFADLGIYPEIGDRILADGRQYEVMEHGEEGAWRWSDPYGIRIRVHTKLIKENE